MSNALAIATVTATLRHLLDRGLNAVPGVVVSTRPPDKARENCKGNQLNLFLYKTTPNAAWRNFDAPRPAGEVAGRPLLALNLHFLLSVYGQDDDDAEPFSHRLLGEAMRFLHDHTVIEPDALREALPGSDLHLQTERVRITHEPMTIDEMSKLWTTFQTPYRLSVSYEVSTVLIESSLR
jgi:hypothetical protein